MRKNYKMKVILAGYSKTGTKTMSQAFKMLGYNNYDVMENAYYLHKEWVKIITVGGTAEDFRRMYEGVDAVTDMPCCIFWEQLHEAFPDAKIILTLRDEDEWYPSLVKQFDKLNNNYLNWLVDLLSPSSWEMRPFSYHTLKLISDVARFPSNRLTLFGETLMKKMYREHNYYVQQKAPKDKLLVYRVTEGWEPLCEFLGEEIPDKPFPHKNKGGCIFDELQKENEIVRTVMLEALASAGLLTVLAAFAGYKLYRGGHFSNIWNTATRHCGMLKNTWFSG